MMIVPLPPQSLASLEIRAMPLAEALPKIGSAFSIPMRAEREIAGEIAIARLDRATLEATKAHLAEAFAAEWSVAPDGTLILAASEARRAAEKRAWFAGRRARVERVLREDRQRAVRLSKFDEREAVRLIDWENRYGSGYGSDSGGTRRSPTPTLAPSERLLIRVLAKMRAEDFVSETQGFGAPFGRRVYSLTPTETQIGLGPEIADALRAYREETWVLEGATSDAPGATRPRKGPATRLLVIASQADGLPSTELSVYDDEGTCIDVAYKSFGDGELVTNFPAGERLPFEVPERTLDQNRTSLDDLLQEPLAGVPSDMLLDAAKKAGRSIVVAPSDVLQTFDQFSKGELTQLFANSAWISGGKIRFDGTDWLSVRAEDPFVARSKFFPRANYRNAAKTLAADATLDDVLRLARLRAPSAWTTPLESRLWRSELSERTRASLYDLRFLAALTPNEWRVAEQGPVPIGGLSEPARSYAWEILYGDSFRGEPTSGCMFGHLPWSSEATNVVAPRDATFRLERTEGLRAEIQSERGRIQIDGESFADLLESPEEGSEVDHTRFYRRVDWTMTVGPAGMYRRLSLTDRATLVDPRYFRRDEIPAEILQDLRTAR